MVTVLAFKPTMLGTHDASACVMRDGEIVAVAEEERFCRRKHAKNVFPLQAIRYCLDQAGVRVDELDAVGIPYDPRLYWQFVPEFIRLVGERRGVIDKGALIGVALTRLGFQWFGPRKLWQLLEAPASMRRPPLQFVSHHLSHGASTYFCSGYAEASVVTIDGVGEYDCSVLWRARDGHFERLRTFVSPNSLGRFYSLFTEYLGFPRLDGEGKLMALAPYGERDADIEAFLGKHARVVAEGYDVTPLLRRFPRAELLEGGLGFARLRRGDALTQRHRNLAWHVQDFAERAVCSLVRENHRRTGLRRVCLAGGVALNCVANKKVAELDCVDELFIQPAAGDSGLALGCAQILMRRLGKNPSQRLTHAFWGPEWDDTAIEALLERSKITYETPVDLVEVVAGALAQGLLVGWFQGRMEMGPRSLGHRSILASPASPSIADRLNREVKGREAWRPFGPSVLAEGAGEWFARCGESPFMVRAFDVREDWRDRIGGVLHPVDTTARVQTVNAETDELYHRLISAFGRLTGVPMLLNTSFNIAGEPIVCTPQDAIGTFFRCGLDLLVLGGFLVRKGNSGN